MSPELYHTFYIYTLLLSTICYSFYLQGRAVTFIYERSNNYIVFIYIILILFLLGLRPLSGVFIDTMNYVEIYRAYQSGMFTFSPDAKEWFFEWLMVCCGKIMDVRFFFLIVECFYILPVLWACYKFIPNHYILMFLFCMGAFSFYSYGVNGIRNGMACSLIIAALACVNGTMKEKIIGVCLCFFAFYTHRTSVLPILCIIISYFVKDIRCIISWWFLSIVLSLVAGGPIEAFFAGLGFDDRMETYSSSNIDIASFSSTGFRWDFLLYSSIPIILGYYVVCIRKIWDKNYLLLLNTYILCNSFWVMMIRATFSNRFAYLSWFMYALVLAYPCLKFPIWKNQGNAVTLILLAHFAFTFIMYEFVY